MPQSSRRRAFAVLSAVQLVIIIDSSIVYVALPAIQTHLGFSAAGLAWVVNAYMVAFGGLLLLSGCWTSICWSTSQATGSRR
ncbi:hypothetical protein [Nonomuraea bangladeshensis]|uniref:hypothetical protein n=1 Tax=Nonomuraea bangladeshensis TaxID=404385 RepID=UPI003C2F804E